MNSEILIFNFGHFITVMSIMAALFVIKFSPAQQMRINLFIGAHPRIIYLLYCGFLIFFSLFILNEYAVRSKIYNTSNLCIYLASLFSYFFGLLSVYCIYHTYRIIFVSKIKITNKNHKEYSIVVCDFLNNFSSKDKPYVILTELSISFSEILNGSLLVDQKYNDYNHSCQKIILNMFNGRVNFLEHIIKSKNLDVLMVLFKFMGKQHEINYLGETCNKIENKNFKFWNSIALNLCTNILQIFFSSDKDLKSLWSKFLFEASKDPLVCQGLIYCVNNHRFLTFFRGYKDFVVSQIGDQNFAQQKESVFHVVKNWINICFKYFIDNKKYNEIYKFYFYEFTEIFRGEPFYDMSDTVIVIADPCEDEYNSFIKKNYENIFHSCIFKMLQIPLYKILNNTSTSKFYIKNKNLRFCFILYCLSTIFIMLAKLQGLSSKDEEIKKFVFFEEDEKSIFDFVQNNYSLSNLFYKLLIIFKNEFEDAALLIDKIPDFKVFVKSFLSPEGSIIVCHKDYYLDNLSLYTVFYDIESVWSELNKID